MIEPDDGALVLFEFKVDKEVWFRDDEMAYESYGAHPDDHWFKCGDDETDPISWKHLLRSNPPEVGPILLVRAP